MVTFPSGRGVGRFVHLLTRDLARRNCGLVDEYQYLVGPVARKDLQKWRSSAFRDVCLMGRLYRVLIEVKIPPNILGLP